MLNGDWHSSKSTGLQLVDVFILGPLMIWTGVNAKQIPFWVQGAMVFFGITTVWYNGVNYLDKTRRVVC